MRIEITNTDLDMVKNNNDVSQSATNNQDKHDKQRRHVIYSYMVGNIKTITMDS